MNTIAELNGALDGRYLVEKEIGQGGMATVYLAQDPKHDRKVAIKVLKPELAAVLGPERFVVEIKTTASLQHPHILPLFDSGSAGGMLYYVMPYLEGETLREKLNRETQFSVTEAVKISREVADALDYAHRHQVIHRDIKPENIMLHDGRPMVMDFGIALAVSAAAGGRMTETGLSLGTPHYMSPEQATAEKEISARSDIYSLGSVLYEMLTGQPPHLGGSAQQIVMKIIAEEVAPVTKLRKAVPIHVAAAVAKSLEKLPADRFDNAKSFGEALGDPEFRTAQTGSTFGGANEARWKRRFLIAAACILCLITAVTAMALSNRNGEANAGGTERTFHLRLPLPPGDSLSGPRYDIIRNAGRPSRTAFALAPDGQALVYAGKREGKRQLFLRMLATESIVPLPGTEDGESPFYSPDGKSVGYWSDGILRRITLPAGPVTDIGPVARISGASWSTDDRIIVGVPDVGLLLFSLLGAPKADTVVKGAATLPQFLPGNESVVFSLVKTPLDINGFQIELLDLKSRKHSTLIPDAADPRVLPGGRLLFVRAGQLFVVGLDTKSAGLSGDPVLALSGVMQAIGGINTEEFTAASQLSVTPTGHLAYLPGGVTPDHESEILWIDRQGNESPISEAGRHSFLQVRLSPEGKRFAVSIRGTRPAIEIFDLETRTSQFIATSGLPKNLIWSRDGRSIIYDGLLRDSSSLFRVAADGSSKSEPLIGNQVVTGGPAFWSADGKDLFILQANLKLYRVSSERGTIDSVPGFQRAKRYPTITPDQRWVAYVQAEPVSGQATVYVQDWPELKRKWKVATGSSPAWTRNGAELTYVASGGLDDIGRGLSRVMAVNISPGQDFKAGAAKELFVKWFGNNSPILGHDVAPDGSRFLVRRTLTQSYPPGEIHLVVNWFSTLRELTSRTPSTIK